MFIKSEATRRYIYGIIAAVAGLAFIYGLVNVEQLGGWLVLASAVCGISNVLALSNTSNGKHEA